MNVRTRHELPVPCVVACALLFLAACGEHPKGGGPPPGADVKAPRTEGKPRAEEAAAQDLGGGVTVASLAQAITDHVNAEAAETAGRYQLVDPVTGQTLSLALTKVHEEKLAAIGDNTYFACSDFAADGGKSYDLDFWVKSMDGKLAVTEVYVHKEDGVPRYGWVEVDGIWRQDPPHQPAMKFAVAEPAKEEHPEGQEHPEGERLEEGKKP